jgi:hypothetical protein
MQLIKSLGNFIKNVLKPQRKVVLYESESKEPEHFVSIWDYLSFRENTQASHLSKVIGFTEWVSMKEIFRRIKELFGIEYKNEKSLYPYLKTLTDLGLFETNDAGGQRKWRKKELIIKVKPEVPVEEKEEAKVFA